MPYADPEKARANVRARRERIKADPALLAAKRKQTRENYYQSMSTPEGIQKQRARSRAQYVKNKKRINEHRRQSYLKQRYGITADDYAAMLTRQGAVCAICRRPGKRRLAVDHCHATGRVRGLLCDNCNQAIGKLKDSPELLARSIAYLEKSK